MRFRYNIYGEGGDGIRVYFEDYLNPDETYLIYTVKGPLAIDKWYTAVVQIDQTAFEQFRVSQNTFWHLKANK